MKTLQEQYNLIKEGKGHKDVFLKEAKSRYPNMISNVLTYDQVTTILKQRSIIKEHTLCGVASNLGKKPDWFSIFEENIQEASAYDYVKTPKEYVALQLSDTDYEYILKEAQIPSNIAEFAKRKGISSLVRKVAGWAERVGARIAGGTAIGYNYNTLVLDLNYKQQGEIHINTEDETITLYGEYVYSFPKFKEVYEEEKSQDESDETLKENLNKNSYKYEDKKNIDNLNGEEFQAGISFEMSKVAELLTSVNMGEYLDKARKTVTKNLASNPLYYIENAAFGQEGIGYTKDVLGLTPTEIKGKEKASGYGDATKKENNDKFIEVKESKISFKDLLNN